MNGPLTTYVHEADQSHQPRDKFQEGPGDHWMHTRNFRVFIEVNYSLRHKRHIAHPSSWFCPNKAGFNQWLPTLFPRFMRIFHRAYSLMFITMCFIPFVKSQRTYEALTPVIITKKCLLTYHIL